MGSAVDVITNSVPEFLQSVIAQRKPELQCTKAARELDALFEEGEILHRVIEIRLGIVARMRERPLRIRHITIQQASAINGLVKPLMGIEGDGVGSAEADELAGFGDGCQRSIGAINVEPRTLLLRDRRQF